MRPMTPATVRRAGWKKRETPSIGNLKARIAELEAEREHAVYAYVSTRIAELEAEQHSWREAIDRVWLAFPKNLPGKEPGTVDASVHVAWMTARIAELEAALAPFAEWSRKLDAEFGDHEDDIIAGGVSGGLSITFGDLRRAARARPTS